MPLNPFDLSSLLPPSGTRILEQLVRDALRVVSYHSLSMAVSTTYESGITPIEVIRVHVQHIRSKLRNRRRNVEYIENIRGIGYKLIMDVLR